MELTGRDGVWTIDLARRVGSPGGFGEVFVGASPDGEEVAIKRVRLDPTEGDLAELLLRELEFAGYLKRGGTPSGLISYFDVAQDEESLYLVMELAERSLRDVLTGSPMPGQEVVPILLDVLHGLQSLDELDDPILHRDLKPENILQVSGQWKLCDFGLARFREKGTGSPTFKGGGTPAYMAPEVWRGESPTVQTDLYSVGCIAYEMAIGEAPFTGSASEIREGHLEREPSGLDGIEPLSLRRVVRGMLTKTPAGRPGSAAQVTRVLRSGDAPESEEIAGILEVISEHEKRVAERAAEDSARLEQEARFQVLVQDGDRLLKAHFEEARGRLSEYLEGVKLGHRDQHDGSGQLARLMLSHEHGSLMITIWGHEAQIGHGANSTSAVTLGEVKGRSSTSRTEVLLANVVLESRESGPKWMFYRFTMNPVVRREAYTQFGGDPDRVHGLPREVFIQDIGNVGGGGMHVYTVSKVEVTQSSIIDLLQEALALV